MVEHSFMVYRLSAKLYDQGHNMNSSQAAEERNIAEVVVRHVSKKLKNNEVGRMLGRAWVFKAETAVFDFIVKGHEIAVDVKINNNSRADIAVFGRKDRSKDFLRRANFLPSTNDRRQCSTIEIEPNSELFLDRIMDSILQIISEIKKLNKVPSDAIVSKVMGEEFKVVVADVGANALSEPPYNFLKHAGHCHIVGFEPQTTAFDILISNKTNDEDYFNHAIGKNGKVNINIYSGSGFSSVYHIDEKSVDLFPKWRSGTRLKQVLSIDSKALDDIPNFPKVDLLKIDIQGGELDVFQGAKQLLKTTLSIITEVSFFPLYHSAPSFADIHKELTQQGFVLHKFLHQVRAPISNSFVDDLPAAFGVNQLVDGDAVYIKDFRDMADFDARSLKALALISHYVFDSKDLTIRILAEIVSRGEIGKDALQQYIASLQ
jgi:FkbM family methyltransferase